MKIQDGQWDGHVSQDSHWDDYRIGMTCCRTRMIIPGPIGKTSVGMLKGQLEQGCCQSGICRETDRSESETEPIEPTAASLAQPRPGPGQARIRKVLKSSLVTCAKYMDCTDWSVSSS